MAGYNYSDFLKPYNDIKAIAEKINNIEKNSNNHRQKNDQQNRNK